jgi:ABC-type transporter Mla subunit MlaD
MNQDQNNSLQIKEKFLAAEMRFRRLESIVEKIGESVIATTETVERMATRVDALAVQIQHQAHQVQQQGYQIFALTDELKTLIDNQGESRKDLQQLTTALQNLINVIKTENQH